VMHGVKDGPLGRQRLVLLQFRLHLERDENAGAAILQWAVNMQAAGAIHVGFDYRGLKHVVRAF
jgi:hypothetical protein